MSSRTVFFADGLIIIQRNSITFFQLRFFDWTSPLASCVTEDEPILLCFAPMQAYKDKHVPIRADVCARYDEPAEAKELQHLFNCRHTSRTDGDVHHPSHCFIYFDWRCWSTLQIRPQKYVPQSTKLSRRNHRVVHPPNADTVTAYTFSLQKSSRWGKIKPCMHRTNAMRTTYRRTIFPCRSS